MPTEVRVLAVAAVLARIVPVMVELPVLIPAVVDVVVVVGLTAVELDGVALAAPPRALCPTSKPHSPVVTQHAR